MANPWHVNWLKEGVKRWNKRRTRVQFCPDLAGLNFYEVLPEDFRDDPKTSRYFEKINLSGSILVGADLSRLNFTKANFSSADLSGANLSKTNFTGALFNQATLVDVVATLSDFRRAKFDGALLSRAQLAGANFSNAKIAGEGLSTSQKDEIVGSPGDAEDSFVANYSMSRDHLLKSGGLEEKKKTKKIKYDVFYATNRVAVFERGAITNYSGQNSGLLSYGICEVTIPENRRIGRLGSPLWRRLFNGNNDSVRIESIVPLNDDLFWDFVSQSYEKMKVKANSVIFVHGYKNSFKDSVIRAAQIGYDLGIGQGIGLFSWPSKNKYLGYSADEAAVDVSKYLLSEFLERFSEKNPGEKFSIIAHSMGCRCLVGALEILAHKKASVLGCIDQIILAAADVDVNSMRHQSTSFIKHLGGATSYSCKVDVALKLSTWLHSYPRIGITPPTFVIDGINTIIVNNHDLGSLAHGYFSSSRIVLSDIFYILRGKNDPSGRHGLKAVVDRGAKYWELQN